MINLVDDLMIWKVFDEAFHKQYLFSIGLSQENYIHKYIFIQYLHPYTQVFRYYLFLLYYTWHIINLFFYILLNQVVFKLWRIQTPLKDVEG